MEIWYEYIVIHSTHNSRSMLLNMNWQYIHKAQIFIGWMGLNVIFSNPEK